MSERSRSPSLVWLSSQNIPSVFFDTSDENVIALLYSKERIQTVKNWDRIIAVAASNLSTFPVFKKASRESAYAISLLLNATSSFKYISSSIASGDIFVGLSCLRFSLESIVRAGSIVLADEHEREEILYRYENDVRDHSSRRRCWFGEINSDDNLPRRLGKILSNPLDDSKYSFYSKYYTVSEFIIERPSMNSDRRADEGLKFPKLLVEYELPIWHENSQRMRNRIEDWHDLSSSFIHADVFSSDLANRFRSDPNLKKTLLCEIYLDVTELITDLFAGTVFHLLEDLELATAANVIRSSREKFLIGAQE